MADYKRVISYLYNYQNKVKTNNVGFVRLEVRDGMCKMTVHLRVPLLKVEEIPIYGYTIKDDSMTAVPIGTMRVRDGVGDCKLTTPADNIKNSMYSIDEMEGIILYISNVHYFAAQWEDNSIVFDEFIVREQKEGDSIQEVKASEITRTPYVAIPREENLVESSKEQEESVQSEEVNQEIEQEMKQEERNDTYVSNASISDTVVKNEEEKQESLEEQSLDEKTQNQEGSFEEEKLEEKKEEGMDQQAQEFFDNIMQASNILGMFQKGNREQLKKSEEQSIKNPLESMAESMSISTESDQQEPEMTAEQVEVSPKSAIECLEAFQTCESQQDYQEIQSQIQSLQAQALHLENVCDKWLAKVKEEEEQEHQRILQKQSYENQVREEINLDPELFQPTDGEMEQQSINHNNRVESSTVVSRIFAKYPKITPFSKGVVDDCVKIEPQDIGIFPMENWILANNSFLLHGYYSYRHLVFIKRHQGQTCEYLLGVPGVNHSREQFMAKMFGFDQFHCVTGEEPNTGDFGYWCMNINM